MTRRQRWRRSHKDGGGWCAVVNGKRQYKAFGYEAMDGGGGFGGMRAPLSCWLKEERGGRSGKREEADRGGASPVSFAPSAS